MDDIELLDIDELNQIIREAINKNLHGENTFKPEELQIWNDAIVHQCLDKLSKLSKPYKFIVTCIINQRDGAGVYSHSSCFLNTDTDSIATIRWDNDVMHCVVSVYSLALNWIVIYAVKLSQFANEFVSSSNMNRLFSLHKLASNKFVFISNFFLTVFSIFHKLIFLHIIRSMLGKYSQPSAARFALSAFIPPQNIKYLLDIRVLLQHRDEENTCVWGFQIHI